jgi:glutathione S-transferase
MFENNLLIMLITLSGIFAFRAPLFRLHKSAVSNHHHLLLEMRNDVLYDVPVSNHGARIRIIIKEKGIQNIDIRSPQDIGGLKSKEYLALNPRGKMPMYVTYINGKPLSVYESDTIAQYLVDKYEGVGNRMIPEGSYEERMMCNQLCAIHDHCLSDIQGILN